MSVQQPDRSSKCTMRPFCSHCGSDDVLFDAYAVYDPETEGFELFSTFDTSQFCQYCEGECSIIWSDSEPEVTP